MTLRYFELAAINTGKADFYQKYIVQCTIAATTAVLVQCNADKRTLHCSKTSYFPIFDEKTTAKLFQVPHALQKNKTKNFTPQFSADKLVGIAFVNRATSRKQLQLKKR